MTLKNDVIDFGKRTEPAHRLGMSKTPNGFITRNQLKGRASLSETDLKRLEQHGVVKATRRTSRGYALYPESLVEELISGKFAGTTKIEYTTGEAAVVFRMLKEGRPHEEIVIEAQVHPAVLKSILADYYRMTGCIFVPKVILDRISELPLDGPRPIETAEALLEICETAVKDATCPRCVRRPKGLCTGCARQVIKGAREANSTEGPHEE